ncbi:MAG TPA: BTAD domain-containing putative transcriptional regulator [Solirubrobacterales bacterium]|jgi:DNA-binding SARP family transcriptional activator|nr:BTAD domain-containing putative transcriptional regulator [Solirubrobacterales bacterium]
MARVGVLAVALGMQAGGGVEAEDKAGAGPRLGPERVVAVPEFFERFPYGLTIAEPEGTVISMNHLARRLLLPAGGSPATSYSCCELICSRLGSILGTGCIGERAVANGRDLPEVRIDIDGERLQTSAWVTASTLGAERSLVLFHLRPGRPNDRRRRTRQGWHGDSEGGLTAQLKVHTLGRFSVEGQSGPLNGDWLDQLPGQVFKYLVSERRRLLASDQIVEALWPGTGPEEGRNRLRFHIHALRERIEPGRGEGEGQAFVSSRRGGYMFDTALAWVDADEFEREARAGLGVPEENPASALPHLLRASELYRGDFMVEERYSEWAREERERLRELAGRALRTCVQLQIASGDLEAAVDPARRLAELEPYDADSQRLVIDLCLRRGRKTEAMRRYMTYRKQVIDLFGEPPPFDVAEIAGRGRV